MQNAMLAAQMGQGAPMQGEMMPGQDQGLVTVQIPAAMLPALEAFMQQIGGQEQPQAMPPQMMQSGQY